MMMNFSTFALFLLSIAIITVVAFIITTAEATAIVKTTRKPACLPPFRDTMPFCNTSLPLATRVRDLVSRIKTQDKPALLTARGWPQGNLSGIPYLGVPPIDNGLNCVRSVQSTCVDGICPTLFTNPTSLGASWNMSNVYEMAKVIGIEARALFLAGAREPSKWSGNPLIDPSCWSPNSNTGPIPTWGRIQEIPSESPLIGSEYITAYARGMQRNDDIDSRYIQCITTQKHFAAYDVDNTTTGLTRYSFNAKVSPHDLAETFLPVFKAGVKDGGVKSIMISYNAATFPYPGEENGVPTAASRFLRDTLRQKWNFSGFTTSDTDSVATIYRQPPEGHAYVKTGEEAVALALRNGQCDMNSGGTYVKYIPSALDLGLISEEDLDRALFDLYKVRFELGFFDPIENQPFWNIPLSSVNTDASKFKSYHSAVQGMVLLQNKKSVLPLSDTNPRIKRIAIIGPSINDSRVLLGNYLGQTCPTNVDDFSCVQNMCQAFQSRVYPTSGISIQCAQGSFHDAPASPQEFEKAIEIAKNSDVIILGVGLDQNLEAEMHDRTSLLLPLAQKKLIQAVRYANPAASIIMVMINGGVLAIEDELPLVDAVLEAWYPGFYGANAIVDIIFGDQHPAGRLPLTMYFANYTQYMKETDMSMSANLGRTYRYVKVPVLFPFGFGLSYYETSYGSSSFLFSLSTALSTGIFATVQTVFTPVGTGPKSVDDVMQVYLLPTFSNAIGHSVVPIKMLLAFERISATELIGTEFKKQLKLESLCLANDSGHKELVAGKYNIALSNIGMYEGSTITQSQFVITDALAGSYTCEQVF